MNGKINNYSNYTFLKDGTVLSKTGRQLKGKIIKGRRYIRLKDDSGVEKQSTVARWILMAFTKEEEWNGHVHHKNGNHTMDSLENLEWKNEEDHRKLHFDKIVCVNLKSNDSVVFENETDASKTLNIPIQEISRVIVGERAQTHGMWFTKIKKLGGSPTS